MKHVEILARFLGINSSVIRKFDDVLYVGEVGYLVHPKTANRTTLTGYGERIGNKLGFDIYKAN